MYTVTIELEFCYGHRMLAYDGKCRFPHGHNGKLQISLEGAHLDQCGMMYDFTALKRDINRWIDDTLDHRMILNEHDPLVKFLQDHNEPVCIIPGQPSTETIAKMIFDHCQAAQYPVTAVTLWETSKNYATYRKE